MVVTAITAGEIVMVATATPFASVISRIIVEVAGCTETYFPVLAWYS